MIKLIRTIVIKVTIRLLYLNAITDDYSNLTFGSALSASAIFKNSFSFLP